MWMGLISKVLNYSFITQFVFGLIFTDLLFKNYRNVILYSLNVGTSMSVISQSFMLDDTLVDDEKMWVFIPYLHIALVIIKVACCRM